MCNVETFKNQNGYSFKQNIFQWQKNANYSKCTCGKNKYEVSVSNDDKLGEKWNKKNRNHTNMHYFPNNILNNTLTQPEMRMIWLHLTSTPIPVVNVHCGIIEGTIVISNSHAYWAIDCLWENWGSMV